jgi:hypothetical protein
LRTLKRSIFGQFVAVACLCFADTAHAQTPSVTANLATGIGQVRAGDFFTALFTLNQVVRQASERPEDAPTLARAHAFRALAYEGLNQPDRAKAAVDLAIAADPNVALSPAEFSTRTIALFDAARRGGSAAPPAAPAVKTAVLTGTILVFRRHSGGGRRIAVTCDGVKVADLQNDRSVALTALPGTHYLDIGGDRLAVDVAAGEIHYIRLGVKFMAGWTMQAVTAGAARAEIAERTIGPADANRIYNTHCAQQR